MPRLRLRDLTMPLVLAVLAAGFAAASPEFLAPRNLSMLMIELAVTAVLALGMLMVILPGQIDLSAGSGVGLIGGVAAVLVFRAGWPAPGALAVATLVALLIWTAMGELIVRMRVPSFIVSLGGLLVFKGSFWLTIRSSTVPVTRGEPNLYSALATTYLPPPLGLALAGVFTAVMAVLMAHRRRSSPRGGTRDRDGGDHDPPGHRRRPVRPPRRARLQPLSGCTGRLPDPLRGGRVGARDHGAYASWPCPGRDRRQ